VHALARNSDQQWTTSVGGMKSLTQTATHLRQGAVAYSHTRVSDDRRPNRQWAVIARVLAPLLSSSYTMRC
jgi:hypothetical protein